MSQVEIGKRIVLTLVDPPYTVLFLDATEEVRVTVKASTPKFPVASGRSLIDNYQVEPEERSFSGIITSSKISDVYGSELDAEAYVTTIRKIFNQGLKVNINIPDGGSLNNCGITSFSAVRNKQSATSFKVDITVKEILYVDAVETTSEVVVKVGEEDVLAQKLSNNNIVKEVITVQSDPWYNIGSPIEKEVVKYYQTVVDPMADGNASTSKIELTLSQVEDILSVKQSPVARVPSTPTSIK